MKQRLSFAYFTLLEDNIVEVIVDENIEMTLEMVEECHQFIDKYCPDDFALLINRVNHYDYSYEAKLSLASYENLKAIAFVYYTAESKNQVNQLAKIRAHDAWNVQTFAGLNMGWQEAYNWLQQELLVTCEK
ncbi:hypothetical protein [Thalassotalea profundi]|uniref:STAS/SEC14 domain-containing protein n=1 Tax=Thalassotalea profundi TaxID=2036687 RepID=A0ABQ3IZ03_9GAMM|nr:hypothetical protein [Thalassotalea profundi]GHE98929.1 hypothetical protein GCM10011501_30490 [Thalassotalea profundi]